MRQTCGGFGSCWVSVRLLLLEVFAKYYVVCIGSDMVDWLYKRVEGFKERRDARKYGAQILKVQYICMPVL